MKNSVRLILIILVIHSNFSKLFGQNSSSCNLSLKGSVVDDKSKKAVTGAVVYIKELSQGVSTDSLGNFKFIKLCKGKYTLMCEFIGYNVIHDTLILDKSRTLQFSLKSGYQELNEIVITGEKEKNDVLSTVPTTSLTGIQLDETRGESLGETLKDMTGLSSIETGPGISKPVIHGLHSNRVLILNNGVRQEGQQWGQDHAPEIDPFIAGNIEVIKGPASIMYGSDAIGGVILLEPDKLPEKGIIDGDINLVGGSNNKMGAGSVMVEGTFGQIIPGLSWRINGTYREAGNAEAPHYYLDNTGFSENDYSAALDYIRKKIKINLYFSQFASKIGILEASHIGNELDLQQAIDSPEPIEKSEFTFKITTPYQPVFHRLFKGNGILDLDNYGQLEVTYAIQTDSRKEFSPDEPYNISYINAPENNFYIVTSTADIIWHLPEHNFFSGDVGISGITQANVYSGLDYYSVIPNFRNYGSGIYWIEKWTKDKLTIEAGLRYDYLWQQVYMYDSSLKYVAPLHVYTNPTTSLGVSYKLSDKFLLDLNYGSAWRAPGPNELYGEGVHLDDASFERGDANLGVERAFDFSTDIKFQNKLLNVELGLYDNIINNFIYLQPQPKPVYLSSGIYPYFLYTQANVVFRGIDLDITYRLTNRFSLTSKSTIIRAWNYSINNWLIFVPADRTINSIRYDFKPFGKFKQFYVVASNIYVAHQWRVPPDVDYAPPPAAYTLFNAEIGAVIYIKKRPVTISFSANNIFNIAYRDYMDRLRYFADEAGRNLILRLKIPLFSVETK